MMPKKGLLNKLKKPSQGKRRRKTDHHLDNVNLGTEDSE